MSYIQWYLDEVSNILHQLPQDQIAEIIRTLELARMDGKHIFLIGNGGSAATASHFATDIGKGASYGKPVRFKVVALTDSMSTITAYANDVGYEVIFAEQLRNLAQPGDVLVTISGSGTSPNIIRAIEAAQGIGLDVVSLTGFEGGVSGPMSDIHINVPSDHMGRIEDVHMALCHAAAFFFMDNDDHTAH